MGTIVNTAWTAAGRAPGREEGRIAQVIGWLAARLRGMSRSKGEAEKPLLMDARLSLGPKAHLALISCCGRKVLLAVSGEAITPVMEWTPSKRKTARKSGPAAENEAQR